MILTRFSVRAGPESPQFTPEWLEHRLWLFESYCVPSFAAQSCSRFRWLVFCDESTDHGCVERLRGFEAELPQLAVVTTTPGAAAYRVAVDQRRPGDKLLVSTRIDSDDGSSVDLVERVQDYVTSFLASDQDAAVLAFARGFKLLEQESALYETWNPHSPHLSMFERLDRQRAPVTVQSGNHGFMQEHYPLHVDAGAPVWLQVLHGGNVSNHVHPSDRQVDAAALRERFALQLRRAAPRAVPAPQPADADGRAAFRQALEEALLSEDERRAVSTAERRAGSTPEHAADA